MLPLSIPLPRLSWELPHLSLPRFPEVFGSPERLAPVELKPCADLIQKWLPESSHLPLGDRLHLEKWTRLFREAPRLTEHPLDAQNGAPFLVFVGIAALIHLVAGWGLYHYFVKRKADPETAANVALSQRLLRDWRQNPAQKIPLWSYFVTVENPHFRKEDEGALLQRLATKMAEWNGLTLPAMVRAFYWDFLHHYGRDYPRMSDYFQAGKGNCVAQTKLVLAMLSEKLTLAPDEGLGVQVFKRHLAPVFLKKDLAGKIVEVRNLVTGRKQDKVVAPIYQPPALIAAYIRAKGEEPEVSFQELLVASPSPGDAQKVAKPSEEVDLPSLGLEFPASEAEYDGDAPEDAFLPPPEWEGESSAGVVPPDKDVASKSHLFESFSPWKQKQWNDFGVDFSLEEEEELDNNHNVNLAWNFRRIEDRDHYYKLSSVADRYQFLWGLLRVRMQYEAGKPEFQQAIELFNKPAGKLSQLDASALRKIAQIGSNFREYKETLRQAILAHQEPLAEHEKRWKELAQSSGWMKFNEGQKSFTEAFKQDPANFLLLLDGIPHWEKRSALCDLMNYYQNYVSEGEYSFGNELARLVSNPALVGIETASGEKISYRPLLSEVDIVEVESPDLLPKDSTQKPAAEGVSVPAKTLISRELLMQMILRLTYRETVLPRWTDELSKAFSQMAPTQSQDDQFISFAFALHNRNARFVPGGKSAFSRDDLLVSPYLPQGIRSILGQIKVRKGTDWQISKPKPKIAYPPP